MTVEPIHDYNFEFAKDENGNDIKYRFMLTTKKPLNEIKDGIEMNLVQVGGIDFIQPGGRYTLEIVVARTFDPEQVIDAIKKVLDEIQSDIITPNKTIITA
jgi:hypothetical protein